MIVGMVCRVVEALVLLLLRQCLLVHGFSANHQRYRSTTLPVWNYDRWAIATTTPRATRSRSLLAADHAAKGDGEVSIWGIPTLDQLQSDPFMDQVRHAEFLVGLLPEDAGRQTDVVMRRLRAQLSHSDGRRGFLVTFLTTTYNENGAIPPSVVTVLVEQMIREYDKDCSTTTAATSTGSATSSDSSSTLVLLFMNIVMPTAMKTLHEDQELSLQSARTAATATRLLQAVSHRLSSDKDDSSLLLPPAVIALELERHGRAIWTVAATTTETKESLPMEKRESLADDLEAFWDDFMDRWGYAAPQRSDIARVMESLWPSI
jgi:hypothetical protein